MGQQSSQPSREVYQVKVRSLHGRLSRKEMVVGLGDTEEQFKNTTVLQLKEKIAQKLPESIGEVDLLLIFTATLLDDSVLLADYGVKNMSVFYLVGYPKSGATI